MGNGSYGLDVLVVGEAGRAGLGDRRGGIGCPGHLEPSQVVAGAGVGDVGDLTAVRGRGRLHGSHLRVGHHPDRAWNDQQGRQGGPRASRHRRKVGPGNGQPRLGGHKGEQGVGLGRDERRGRDLDGARPPACRCLEEVQVVDAGPVGGEEKSPIREPFRAGVDRVVVRHPDHAAVLPDGHVPARLDLELEGDAAAVRGDARQVDLRPRLVEEGLDPSVLEPEPAKRHLSGGDPGHVGHPGSAGSNVGIGGPLPGGEAGAAPGFQVDPPEVAPEPVEPVVILYGDDGLHRRAKREGPVGGYLRRKAEVHTVRRGSPDPLWAVEAAIPVGHEAPVR
jgi:hypothetical protein